MPFSHREEPSKTKDLCVMYGQRPVVGQKKWPAGAWLYEEAIHHVRPADPTDPGDAADLSKSMGYSVPALATLQSAALPAPTIKPMRRRISTDWFIFG